MVSEFRVSNRDFKCFLRARRRSRALELVSEGASMLSNLDFGRWEIALNWSLSLEVVFAARCTPISIWSIVCSGLDFSGGDMKAAKFFFRRITPVFFLGVVLKGWNSSPSRDSFGWRRLKLI